MTVQEIRERVAQIGNKGDFQNIDAEIAHSSEDSLHQDVLKAIANGECDDPAACAAEALKTLEISFSRWCA